MKCNNCDSNKSLDIGYHIWDADDTLAMTSDLWYIEEDIAIKEYNKLVKKEPNRKWRLAIETYCEDCTNEEEGYLESNDC